MKQQINLTLSRQSDNLEAGLQELINELGVEGAEVLLQLFQNDKQLRKGVKNKVQKELKKKDKTPAKKSSVFDLLG